MHIGDRVRVVIMFDDDSRREEYDREIAKIVKIDRDKSYPYTIKFEDEYYEKRNNWLWDSYQLELIDQDKHDEVKRRKEYLRSITNVGEYLVKDKYGIDDFEEWESGRRC